MDMKFIKTTFNLSFNDTYDENIILSIFNGNLDSDELFYDMDNSNVLNLFGLYYNHIEKNYEQMKKYYIMAIEKNNIDAMINFACYYKNIEKNYEHMKKYYLMAIDNGNVSSMLFLASHYNKIEKNYDMMEKYYLMAIDKGNVDAI
jgi:TPR repeat protein